MLKEQKALCGNFFGKKIITVVSRRLIRTQLNKRRTELFSALLLTSVQISLPQK